MNIYTQLAIIQKKLKANKSQRNSFGNYNYRSCEDILEAVKPLLDETQTVLIISDQMKQLGERYYIEATATIILANDPQQRHSNTAYAREEETKKGMDGSQITGASSSYARKYALNGLFAIDDNKDSDTTNHHGKDDDDKKPDVKPPYTPKPDKTPTKSLEEINKEMDKKYPVEDGIQTSGKLPEKKVIPSTGEIDDVPFPNAEKHDGITSVTLGIIMDKLRTLPSERALNFNKWIDLTFKKKDLWALSEEEGKRALATLESVIKSLAK